MRECLTWNIDNRNHIGFRQWVVHYINNTNIKINKFIKNKNYISIKLIYKENSKQIEIRKLTPIVKKCLYHQGQNG